MYGPSSAPWKSYTVLRLCRGWRVLGSAKAWTLSVSSWTVALPYPSPSCSQNKVPWPAEFSIFIKKSCTEVRIAEIHADNSPVIVLVLLTWLLKNGSKKMLIEFRAAKSENSNISKEWRGSWKYNVPYEHTNEINALSRNLPGIKIKSTYQTVTIDCQL